MGIKILKDFISKDYWNCIYRNFSKRRTVQADVARYLPTLPHRKSLFVTDNVSTEQTDVAKTQSILVLGTPRKTDRVHLQPSTKEKPHNIFTYEIRCYSSLILMLFALMGVKVLKYKI